MPVTDDHGYVQFVVVNLVLSSFTTHQQIFNISVSCCSIWFPPSRQINRFLTLVCFMLLNLKFSGPLFRPFTDSFSSVRVTATDYCFDIFKLVFIVICRLVYRFRSQCLFFNLYSCPVSHMKWLHKVRP